MRVLRIILPVALTLLGALALSAQQFEKIPETKPQPATQTPAAGAKIAIINIDRALASTQEGKKAAEELEAQFAPRRAELEKLQNELNNLNSQLQAQQRTLSPEARQQLIRQIEQKNRQGTRLQEDYQADVNNAQTDVLQRLGPKLQAVINQYAQQNGIHVVLGLNPNTPSTPAVSAVYVGPGVNITDEIIRLYDQTHPIAATGSTQPGQGAKPTGPSRQ